MRVHSSSGNACRCLPKPWERILTPSAADKNCGTKFIGYPYHTNKFLRCGDEFTMATPEGAVEPEAGRWYTLTSYIKMNTAGALLYCHSEVSTQRLLCSECRDFCTNVRALQLSKVSLLTCVPADGVEVSSPSMMPAIHAKRTLFRALTILFPTLCPVFIHNST